MSSDAVAHAIEALRAVCGPPRADMQAGTSGVLPVGQPRCWHCGGSGRCKCSSCGVMKPVVIWAEGDCVACKARTSRFQ